MSKPPPRLSSTAASAPVPPSLTADPRPSTARPKPSVERPKRPMTAYNYFFREERQKILDIGLKSYEGLTVQGGGGPCVCDDGSGAATVTKKIQAMASSAATVISSSSGSSASTSGEGFGMAPRMSTSGHPPPSLGDVFGEEPSPQKKKKVTHISVGAVTPRGFGDSRDACSLHNPPPAEAVAEKPPIVVPEFKGSENAASNRHGKRKRPPPHGKVSFSALGKVIAQRWKYVAKDDLERYNEKAARDKKRYQREMEAYDKACVAAICMRDDYTPLNKQETSDLSSDSGSDGCSSERAKTSSDSEGTESGSVPESPAVGMSCHRPGGRKLSTKQRTEKKSMNALRKEAKEAMRTANERLKASASAINNPADTAVTTSFPALSATGLPNPRQQPYQAPCDEGAVPPTSEITGQSQQCQATVGAAGDKSPYLALGSAMMNSSDGASFQLDSARGTDFSGLSQQQLALIGLQSLQTQAQQGLAPNALSNSQGPSSFGGTPMVPQVDASAGGREANGSAASDIIAAAAQGGFDLAFAMRIGYLAGLAASQRKTQLVSSAPSPVVPTPPHPANNQISENAATLGKLGVLLGQRQQQQQTQQQAASQVAQETYNSEASADAERLNALLDNNRVLPQVAAAPAPLSHLSSTPSSAGSEESNAVLESLAILLQQKQQQAQQQAQAQAQAASLQSVDQIIAGIFSLAAQQQQQTPDSIAATNGGRLHRHTSRRHPDPPESTATEAIAPTTMPAPSTAATGLINSTVTVSSTRTGGMVGEQTQSPPSSEMSLSILSDVASALSDVASADSRGSSSSGSNGSGRHENRK